MASALREPCTPERRIRAPVPIADASVRDAEAVLDEVALLEAALREAVDRRRAALQEGSPGGKHFDAAVAAYGVQLRAWVDLQVDMRLNQVLQGCLDGELAAIRLDSATALGAVERVEVEVSTVTEAQAKLLAVIEGISEELARLKAVVAAFQLGAQLHSAAGASSPLPGSRDEAWATVEKVMTMVDDLKQNVMREQREQRTGEEGLSSRLAGQEQLVADLRRLVEQQEADVAELRLVPGEVADNLRAVDDARKSEVAGLAEMVHQLEHKLEQKFGSWRSELSAEVADNLRAVDDARKSEVGFDAQRLDGMQRDLQDTTNAHADLEARIEGRLQALRSEAVSALSSREELQNWMMRQQQELEAKIEKSEVSLGERLANMQQRLVMELRAETTAAFRNEAAAVAALDEQLWLTDQRLGQRIDELVHLQVRDRVLLPERSRGSTEVASFGKRGGCSPLYQLASTSTPDTRPEESGVQNPRESIPENRWEPVAEYRREPVAENRKTSQSPGHLEAAAATRSRSLKEVNADVASTVAEGDPDCDDNGVQHQRSCLVQAKGSRLSQRKSYMSVGSVNTNSYRESVAALEAPGGRRPLQKEEQDQELEEHDINDPRPSSFDSSIKETLDEDGAWMEGARLNRSSACTARGSVTATDTEHGDDTRSIRLGSLHGGFGEPLKRASRESMMLQSAGVTDEVNSDQQDAVCSQRRRSGNTDAIENDQRDSVFSQRRTCNTKSIASRESLLQRRSTSVTSPVQGDDETLQSKSDAPAPSHRESLAARRASSIAENLRHETRESLNSTSRRSSSIASLQHEQRDSLALRRGSGGVGATRFSTASLAAEALMESARE